MSKNSLIGYEPAEGFLIVEPLEEETSRNFTIAEEGFDQKAICLKVGKDTYYPNTNIPYKAPCKAGDEIVHSSIGFENFRVAGKKYRLVHFSKVLAIKK